MLSASFATISFDKNIGWTWNFYLRLVKRLKFPFFGTEGFSNKSICCLDVTTQKNPLDVPFDWTPGFVAQTLTAVYQFIGNNRIKSFRAQNWRFSRTFVSVKLGKSEKVSESIGNHSKGCQHRLCMRNESVRNWEVPGRSYFNGNSSLFQSEGENHFHQRARACQWYFCWKWFKYNEN